MNFNLFDFDHYTSDFEHDECEAYQLDALCPYALESDWIEANGFVGKKLDKFMNETNQYKRFDPKFAHPDVAYKFAYYDPLHNFAHNHGFSQMWNIIQGVVNKNRYLHVSQIVEKIKGRIEWKTSKVYRYASKFIIESLINPGTQWTNHIPFEVNEHGYLFVPQKPIEVFFSKSDFEQFCDDFYERCNYYLTYIRGVNVHRDNKENVFENGVTIVIKKHKKPTKMIYCSLMDLYIHKSQEDWLKEMEKACSEIAYG